MKSRFKVWISVLAAIIVACIAYLVHDLAGGDEKPAAKMPTDPAMTEKSGASTPSEPVRPPVAAGERYADMDILTAC